MIIKNKNSYKNYAFIDNFIQRHELSTVGKSDIKLVVRYKTITWTQVFCFYSQHQEPGLHLNSSSNKLDRLEEMETTEMFLSTDKEVWQWEQDE